MPPSVQRDCGVRIGRDYPAPLVDHEAAARQARQKIVEARRTADARSESRSIHARHGSRKRTQQRRKRGPHQASLFPDGA